MTMQTKQGTHKKDSIIVDNITEHEKLTFYVVNNQIQVVLFFGSTILSRHVR